MSRSDHDGPPAAPGSPPDPFWAKLAARDPGGRRLYPRVHARVPVRLTGPAGEAVDVVGNDLSPGGLQVRCERAAAARLHAGERLAEAGVECTFRLELELEGSPQPVNGRGRIIHLTPIPDAPPQQQMALGVQFLAIDNGGERVLMRFIEQHLRPAGG